MEECVTFQHRGGEPAQGRWDARSETAHYDRRPDKESPLWDPHTKIIYWWTSSEAAAAPETRALIIVYDGKVWPRPKDANRGYLGFRAVRRTESAGGR